MSGYQFAAEHPLLAVLLALIAAGTFIGTAEAMFSGVRK